MNENKGGGAIFGSLRYFNYICQPSLYFESPETNDNDEDWYNEHDQHKQE